MPLLVLQVSILLDGDSVAQAVMKSTHREHGDREGRSKFVTAFAPVGDASHCEYCTFDGCFVGIVCFGLV